jgi:hypothetical protein
MFSFWRKIQDWLMALILKRLDTEDMLEIISVTTERVTLQSVHLHNEMVLHNKLWISYKVLRLRGDLFNEQHLKVGWIDLSEPVEVPGRGKAPMTVDTHLSHITALFNVLRFWVKDHIPLQLDGKVWIKVLWWDFSLPLKKTIYIKRETISYATKAVKEKRVAEGKLPLPAGTGEQIIREEIILSDEVEDITVPAPPPPLSASAQEAAEQS